MFQSWELISQLTAIENVEAPLYPSDRSSAELRTEALQILRRLDLYDREYHFPSELSGGEQQRVSIARALMKTPRLIFADEPTGNLDADTGHMIMRLLKMVCRRGTSIIIATHNQELEEYADRIIRLKDGKIGG